MCVYMFIYVFIFYARIVCLIFYILEAKEISKLFHEVKCAHKFSS